MLSKYGESELDRLLLNDVLGLFRITNSRQNERRIPIHFAHALHLLGFLLCYRYG